MSGGTKTTEEMLRDLIYWEDPDELRFVYTTEEGLVGIAHQEWRWRYEAPTFAEAVKKAWDALLGTASV